MKILEPKKNTQKIYFLEFGTKFDIFIAEFSPFYVKWPSEFYLFLGLLRFLLNKGFRAKTYFFIEFGTKFPYFKG